MPDTKISLLSSASVALAGTEVLPVVQSGSTVKVTVDNLLNAIRPSQIANGVLYLNGSKQATAGSAMTFDGSNLGIGTTSTARLTVNGNINVPAAARVGYLAQTDVSTVAGVSIANYGATFGATFTGMTNPGTAIAGYDGIVFSTVGVERMRITTNLCLGATASAAVANTTFEIGANKSGAFGALGAGPVDHAYVSGNAYPTGSEDPAFTTWKYTRTGASALYEAGRGGTHLWYTAASGTAGNTTTFFERMRIDNSGNVGINTSGVGGPSTYGGKLNIYSGDLVIADSGTSSGASAPRIGSSAQAIIFKTNSGAGSASEVARIDGSGRLGVGRAPDTTAIIDAQSDANGIIKVRGGTASNQGSAFYGTSGSDTTRYAFGQVSRILGGTPDDNAVVYAVGYLAFASGSAEKARITFAGNQIDYQPAESAQNVSTTLTVANLQARIITSNAAVNLTLPTGTSLEGYTTNMAVNTAFEVTFIATTGSGINIIANGNTTVGALTVAGFTSGTFRFRKTATNTFTVYRIY